jgi:hypothetical protein
MTGQQSRLRGILGVFIWGVSIGGGDIMLAAMPASTVAAAAQIQVSADAVALAQRGTQLRADIAATYQHLRQTKTLSNRVKDGNDVTDIVRKYIPVGTSFEDAEAILRSAGCHVGFSENGHVYGRAAMKDGLLQVKHTFAVDLEPPAPNDYSLVHDVSGTIFTVYVYRDAK